MTHLFEQQAKNMLPRKPSTNDFSDIQVDFRNDMVISMCWESKDLQDFLCKAKSKFPDVPVDVLRETYINGGNERCLGRVPEFLKNRRYRDALFEIDKKNEPNSYTRGAESRGLSNHPYLLDEFNYILKQREHLEHAWRKHADNWLLFCAETAKLPLHTSTIRKYFDHKHWDAQQRLLSASAQNGGLLRIINAFHPAGTIQQNVVRYQPPNGSHIVAGPIQAVFSTIENLKRLPWPSSSAHNEIPFGGAITRKRHSVMEDTEQVPIKRCSSGSSIFGSDCEGEDDNQFWKLVETVATSIMKPLKAVYSLFKLQKRLPESRELYLPAEIADWELWTDEQTLDWLCMFVNKQEHIEFLATSMLNSATIEKIATERYSYPEVGMDFQLFTLIEKHFNKVVNNFNGV